MGNLTLNVLNLFTYFINLLVCNPSLLPPSCPHGHSLHSSWDALSWAVLTSGTPDYPAWASVFCAGQPNAWMSSSPCLGSDRLHTPGCPFADMFLTQLRLWPPHRADILGGHCLAGFELWHPALGHCGPLFRGQMPALICHIWQLRDYVLEEGERGKRGGRKRKRRVRSIWNSKI